jgi:hypothetical protein
MPNVSTNESQLHVGRDQVALIPPELCPRGNRCTHDDTEDQASVGNFPFDPDTGNASGPNFGARVAKPT